MKTRLNKLNRGFTRTNSKRSLGGFTIIEVMIVLAIAGLILAIVFIAVPQLQRNTRDNTRQNIVTRVKAEIETYASNNQGKYPYAAGPDWTSFYNRYLQELVNQGSLNDPSSGTAVVGSASGTPASFSIAAYTAGMATGTGLPANAGDFSVVYGARCNGENLTASGSATATTKKYAVLMGLDRAGTRFCVDNG